MSIQRFRTAPPELLGGLSLANPSAGINVDQAGQGGWHQAAPLPSLAMRGGRRIPQLASTPSLAASSSSRPKLTLAPPSGSPAPRGTSAPVLPTLGRLDTSVSAPSRPTPKLTVSIPTGGAGGSAFMRANDDYPNEDGEGTSSLRTPVPEDRDATVQPRSGDRGGYGYGIGGGGDAGAPEEMKRMTEDLRMAMSRTRSFDTSTPSNGVRSRAHSNAGSMMGSRCDDLDSLRDLTISDHGDSRPGSVHEIDPSPEDEFGELIEIKKLGEGTGGAVDLVRSTKTGQIIARKVSFEIVFGS